MDNKRRLKLNNALQTQSGKNWAQLPRSFRVERQVSAITDGIIAWILASTRQIIVQDEKIKLKD
jgi:hypothetical protein